MSETAQPIAASPKSTLPIYVAVCSLAIILALVLGVGLKVHEVLRHLVQTVPFWIVVILGFRHSRAASWVGLPLFLFWFVLMVLIWAYLLGISRIVTGTFSPIEIAMAIIVGAAAIIGIAAFARSQPNLSLAARLGLFVVMAAFQWGCFRLSFLPSIAHR